jgi:predicted extracellular nuclease
MVTGDLNDFEFGEPGEGGDHPLAILRGGWGKTLLANLIWLIRKDERFTFVFDGNSQVLDHMLVTPTLLGHLRSVDILHFNAGFPAALAADPGTPYRASDHDPIVARFRMK